MSQPDTVLPAAETPEHYPAWIHHVLPFVVWMMAFQMLSGTGAWNYAARTLLGIAALWYWKPWQFNYARLDPQHLFSAVAVGVLVGVCWVFPETPWVADHLPQAQVVYLTWATQDAGPALAWALRSAAFGQAGAASVLPPFTISLVLALVLRPWRQPRDLVSIVGYLLTAAVWIGFLTPLGEKIPLLGPWLATEKGAFPWVHFEDADTESRYDPAICGWWWTMFRIIGSAFVISIIEEFFWRGWMYRWMIKEPFHRIPLGTLRWGALIGAAAFFSVVHHRWLVALLCGICYGLLMVKTRNIWPPVIAHTVTNLMLGIYVVGGEQFRFWA